MFESAKIEKKLIYSEFFTNNNQFAFFAVVYNTHEIFGDINSDIYRGIFIILQYS